MELTGNDKTAYNFLNQLRGWISDANFNEEDIKDFLRYRGWVSEGVSELEWSGRFSVRTGRWFGFNNQYGLGYFKADYNYGNNSFDTPPTITPDKIIGFRSVNDRLLKNISFSYASATDNVEICILVMKVQIKDGVVVSEIIFNSKSIGDVINVVDEESGKYEMPINKDISKNETVMVFLNSVSPGNKTSFLYSTNLTLNYES